jgi:DNA modification methylase
MQNRVTYIKQRFDQTEVSPEWCFKNARSTEQWTHGYHRYPAKFSPNLVKKLIKEYTTESDKIADLFAGCGTTLVEAKVHGRESIGVDINPVAELITKVKTKPLSPSGLSKIYNKLEKSISCFNPNDYKDIVKHRRIDYWFFPNHKAQIAFLYDVILSIRNKNQRDFFLCALSNIMKNCSKWLQSSTKPQLDPQKVPTDPFISFDIQVRKMIKKNKEFYEKLDEIGHLETDCKISLEDARKTKIESDSIGAIITSPPYVTSYEYADIHQLTSFWFEYITDLQGFRKNFIGTFYSLNEDTHTPSIWGQKIVNDIAEKEKRTAKEVANYFNDMYAVGEEMKRILKPDGYACLVIGNTTFREVKIKSAEVFTEILLMLDFKLVEIIKRSIPYKLIPTIRDKKTGRFSKLDNKNSKSVYPEEYILIAKK